MARLFADSYAYIAALDGSKAYATILRENEVVTSVANVAEVAAAVLSRGNQAGLQGILQPILAQCIEPPPSSAASGAVFRRDRRAAGAKCSHIDGLGYATAQGLGIPFLTGDEDFRGVPGVKFVKA